MSRISVVKATYESGYKLRIVFSDKTTKTVDFEPFLSHKPHQVFAFYKQPQHFKQFQIKKGNVVWGDDWDLVFPVEQLHKGRIEFEAQLFPK
jgi:hypothetical protein